MDGLTLTAGAVESGEAIRGITAAGYRVRAPNVAGVSAAIGMMRTQRLHGFSIAGYNEVRGAKVIEYARHVLDRTAPLKKGSHVDSTGYANR